MTNFLLLSVLFLASFWTADFAHAAAPNITSITLPSSPPVLGYKGNDTVDFGVVFDQVVTATDLSSQLIIRVGTGNRSAVLISGSGTNTLTYRLTVKYGWEDLDGIQVLSPLDLGASVIANATSEAIKTSFTPPSTTSILIRAIPPASISNTVPAPGTYAVGQNLDLTVTFSKAVTVASNPRIPFFAGDKRRYANYLSGSGSSTLTFRYTIVNADNAPTGITIDRYIDVSLGTIADAAGNVAFDLNLFDRTGSGVIIYGQNPAILSVTPPSNGSYSVGQSFSFTVNYSRAVTVTGSPRMVLYVGDPIRYATYAAGSGTTSIVFSYTVTPGFPAPTGIRTTGVIQLNGGTMKDVSTADAVLTFPGQTYPSVIVVSPPPTITAVNLPVIIPSPYLAYQSFQLTVVFSEPMTTTNRSRLLINVGSNSTYARYVSGSGTNTFTYQYNVLETDSDADGITILSPLYSPNDISSASGSYPTLTFNPPDASAMVVDGIAPYIISNTKPANGNYVTGQQLDFNLTYSRDVFITGTPRLEVYVGPDLSPTTRYANYLSGSGTNVITFRYTIVGGDSDSDGLSVYDTVELNGGTLLDAVGNSEPRWSIMGDVDIIGVKANADVIPPVLASVTAPANGMYLPGDPVDFNVNFNEAVNYTGVPRIALVIGSTTRYATYLSGSGTTSAIFRYTVQSGDSDLNGITSSSPLQYNGGTIRDIANLAPASLNFTVPNTTGVNVNGTGLATISSITTPANATYKTGNALNFVVNFSDIVNVSGTPRIAMTVGATTYYANYLSGSGSTALTFQYTVLAGHSDNNGIVITSPLQLNGGTIIDLSLVNAALGFTAPSTTGVLVDGIDIVISSITPPANATYRLGQNLDFTVVYNYAATVVGTPRIQLTVGATTLYANYRSGSTTTSHVYRYTTAAGHLDADGINTVGPIGLNGGTVKDIYGDNADLAFTGVNYPSKLVDAVVPTISSMTVSPNGTYITGQFIDFTATFSEAVIVTGGTPRLTLTVGATAKYANYISGTGTNVLVFRYTVLSGDLDTNGIAMTNSITLATITDAALNAANVAFTRPVLTGVNVDATPPRINSVTPPSNATYSVGAVMNFTANFSKPVTIVGSPRLRIDMGGVAKNADYVSGSGSSAIIFSYTVVTNDLDTNGVATLSPLVLNGATIKDSLNLDATLTFTVANFANVRVDGVSPYVSSVTLPANNTYQNGGARRTISFTAVFNEIVTVTGLPRIVLTIGSNTVYANYLSGTGTASIVFRYSVLNTDLDLDGIAIANSGNIDLNGGVIRDPSLQNASLALGSLNTTKIFTVLPSMQAWYDLSDTTKVVLSGANITGMTDKIGTRNVTHSVGGGVPYNANGFNGGGQAYASCTSSGAFNLGSTTTPKSMVAVFRAPPDATNQFLFYATSLTRPMVRFSSIASGGQVTFGINGNHYSAGAWGGSVATASNVWGVSQVAMRAFNFASTQAVAQQFCLMDGELAELFLFSIQPTAANLIAIEAFLNVKYGLNFP